MVPLSIVGFAQEIQSSERIQCLSSEGSNICLFTSLRTSNDSFQNKQTK